MEAFARDLHSLGGSEASVAEAVSWMVRLLSEMARQQAENVELLERFLERVEQNASRRSPRK